MKEIISYFKTRRLLKNTSALELIPILLSEYSTSPEGLVIIHIPRFKSQWLNQRLVREGKPKYFSMHLDEIGSSVWLAIDGAKTTQDICKQISTIFGDRVNQTEERVVKFLSGLYHGKHITFTQLK